jgi:hypothetical protein
LVNSFIITDKSSNNLIARNNSKKDISDDVTVADINKDRKSLAPAIPQRNKLSIQNNLVVGLSMQDQLNNMILNHGPASDSAMMTSSKSTRKIIGKGWVMGVSVNYNFPVSNQEMSTVNANGTNNTLIDFLPSVYARYHFNQKLHIESSFQFSSPQYISNHKLAAVYKDVNPNKKEENAIWLNKLYYVNLPVSVHYKVLPNMTIGSGIQYSYLRRSIMADEIAIWEKQGAGWAKTATEKTIAVKSNSAVKKEKANNGNGGNGGPTPTPQAPLTRIDTVAQTLQSSDLRLVFDVNYSLKRLNMGLRYQFGLNNYINTKSGSYVLPVKDRNQALQLYMRYDIFDKRKKK